MVRRFIVLDLHPSSRQLKRALYGFDEHVKEFLNARGVAMSPGLNIVDSIAASTTPFHRRAGTMRRSHMSTLQINVGKVCNQACHHCHVDAGPKRTESMEQNTAERLMELLERSPDTHTVDITGGAPELNPHFRYLVERSRTLGKNVIDRCNLSVLFEPGQEDLGEFLAGQGVEICASLPCYSKKNVDDQRGKGVFDKSIEGLRLLNRLGYGQPGSELILNLVYNPGGAFLPPEQETLELSYKERLMNDFGIAFHSLFTIANLPISRFRSNLAKRGELGAYMTLLEENFNSGTIESLMCRFQTSVSWDGKLYDCDFNQMLEIPSGHAGPSNSTIWELENLSQLNDSPIAVGNHCYGCTAGAGSSCGGALA